MKYESSEEILFKIRRNQKKEEMFPNNPFTVDECSPMVRKAVDEALLEDLATEALEVLKAEQIEQARQARHPILDGVKLSGYGRLIDNLK